MNVYFNDKSVYNLVRIMGLYYVTLQVYAENAPMGGYDIRFILDTGAAFTVISRDVAERCGVLGLSKKETSLFGFGGGLSADYMLLPGIKILEKLHTNVPVLVPHIEQRVNNKTGERRIMPCVLGLNVLEYYNYFVDTENDKLYLQENKNPRFYSEHMKSGRIFTVDVDKAGDRSVKLGKIK